MNGNQIEPPRRWPHLKRARAFFTYGYCLCDQCGSIVAMGVWAFRNPNGGTDTCWCEKCYDRLEGGRR